MPEQTRAAVEIRVEDDRTGVSPEALERAILDHLAFTCSKTPETATLLDVYVAVAHAVRDRVAHRWLHTTDVYRTTDPKRVYYLSAEYLLGRQLETNLLNIGLLERTRETLAKHDIALDEVLEQEADPGLGNGGLGRLAACFMESMATLGLPGYGYGIRYEFGIFRQEIRGGRQVERPDSWLRFGNPWEIARPEYTATVRFGGRVVEGEDLDGKPTYQWLDTDDVLGVPYDTPIAGFGNNTVNTLRLWRARASEEFDLEVFNDGDYRRAVEQKVLSETISRVLYPNDRSREGRELRLKQQYFFVACSIHDILRRYRRAHDTLDALPEACAIQLNDTHPAIAVAELMRVLVDEEGVPWARAWELCRATLGYTNHTLLPEALERWPVPMFEKLLPRHLQIIYDINHDFLQQVHVHRPGDHARVQRMSIIEEGYPKKVRMAHLSVVGSHSVNGVAALHSELVRTFVLRDFAEMWPERFHNKTNGVTPRRWLLQCNPRLSAAITSRIGREWVTRLERLEELAPLAEDAGFRDEMLTIKRANKVDFSDYVARRYGVPVDPESMFDVQVKRIHEYKRQLMKALHVVDLYRRIKFEGERPLPRTVFIGGKAAPGYAMAKMHIRLICDVAALVNADPDVRDRLRCVFLTNYDVSLAQRVIPATDLSEQISLAGKEASGTGNMKFQMNGGLTIGTLDGANIEIREEVGADNFFLFGLDAGAVRALRAEGYSPVPYIEGSARLQASIDLVERQVFSRDDPGRHAAVIEQLRRDDPYMICADFDSYLACQDRVEQAYADRARWSEMVVHNIAHAGKFSSDRTIREYNADVWRVEPVDVHYERPPSYPAG